MTLEQLRTYRDDIMRVAHKYGATRIRVFGSVARKAADSTSDIDLIVDYSLDATLLDHIGLKQDLEALLMRPVDLVTENGLTPYLRARVLAEAVDL